MSKLNFHKSWENIFNRYNLLHDIKKDGFVDITADAIKAVDGKEPRILTKIDFREKLPNIMKEEGLSILAIKNGLYRIASNDPFIDIQEAISTQIIDLEAPKDIITIDPFNLRSESAALDIAAISDMHNIVFGESSKLTIRGRLRGDLNFHIGNVAYNIQGVQIEVDGGYESDHTINLIEAKIGYSNNINIRQLLYPQLFWQNQTAGRKVVKSYIFYLHGNIFRFIPYYYDGAVGYADHSEEKAFRFKEPTSNFSIYSIQVNLNNIDTSVPFPQADRFETIHTMLLLISENGCMNKEELGSYFDIVERQIDYYFNVLKWLKVAQESNACLLLTQKGQDIMQLPFRQRMQSLATIVFSDPIANAVLHKKQINPSYFQIYNVQSQSTINRRLRTIRSWIKYFTSSLSQN
ncbi:Mu-like prophage protein gp29 [hydrothermal vent metagenome]|uniref:Mu-like prophage protein gp29 n=1 Tax=hydrothermal vent metagenome TaxID=652676 RepID=A0A1W1C9K9_9ZZZZ